MPPFPATLTACAALFLVTGFAIEMAPLLTQSRPKPARLGARVCLWIGTVFLWMSVWAARSAGSVVVDLPWNDRDFLGYWVAGVFTVLSFWRGMSGRRANALLALIWCAGLIVAGIHVAEVFNP